MGDTITCPECGDEAESMEEVKKAHKREVPEFEADDDGVNLYGNKDLYLSKSPLGVRRE